MPLTIDTIDLTNSTNEFTFPVGIPTEELPRVKDIRTISESGGDLYLICTAQELTNMSPKRHYVRPTAAVVDRLDNCAAFYPDVNNESFTDVFRIITAFAKWRMHANGRTFLIMSPPPFQHMAAWERAFATVGIVAAWVENGKYQPSAYSLAPDIKKMIIPNIEAKDEVGEIEKLQPGRKLALWRIPGKSKHELDNMRARLRRVCLAVEQKYQDRRFKTMIHPLTSRWAYVYRMSVDEYDDWANFLPYELAVLQYKGGKTITQELNQTRNQDNG